MDKLASYLDHLTFERGLSPLTRENYARDIRHLLALADKQELQGISSAQIRRFVATLHSRNLNGKSIARMLSAWRGFYAYLGRHHGFSHNPCVGMKAPKSAKTLPQALSPDQAVKLVSIAGDELLVLRDRAIMELFYSSGLRLAEVVDLDINDLDLSDATVVVTGKGNKTRIVPMGSHAVKAMQTWLQARAAIMPQQAGPKDLQAVFIGKQGKRISGRAIQYRLKEWAIKQGMHSNVHPHMLRHSFASHVLQSSGDLRAVQEMLGHANISTTQVYTHLDFQHLAKVYDDAHPRARKK